MLGSSDFSQTFLACDLRRPSQPQVVIKGLYLSDGNTALSQEAAALERLGHHPPTAGTL